MSARARGNRDIVELWGREFNVVKTGLSQAQVVLFGNGLVKQQDTLVQGQERLIALISNAEPTVSEADRIAKGLKIEAKKQAEERAANLIAESEAPAKSEVSRLLKEAQATADRTQESWKAWLSRMPRSSQANSRRMPKLRLST